MTLGEHLFQSTSREAIEKIEGAMDCSKALSIGQGDDFLSMFIHYYGIYKSGKNGARRAQSEPVPQYEELFPTKSLILDFDGTLTLRSSDDMTSWERLWVSCGYHVNDCAELAQKYVKNGKVSPADHKAWCKDTLTKFREKGFSRRQLDEIAREIKLVPGVEDVLRRLHSEGISLFLTSGSIRDIIRFVLGELYDLFDEEHANNFIFDRNELLIDIRGTHYDFEGKAEFIKRVIEKQDVSPLEVLFVGNSLNDVWASNAGARTLCVNPHFTNPNDTRDWTYCIRKMEDFSLILPYLGLESQSI
jgi:phosphoserine phosphatase